MKKKMIILFLLLILSFFLYQNHTMIWNGIQNFKNSFYRTLLFEDRYKIFIKGLTNTILISVLSILFGTILGFILFILGRKEKTIQKITTIFIRLLQGIPITVLLLIFYYVIFGMIDINPVLVAVITFSIYFSAYAAEVMKGAYASINKNQIYSAYSMGFTKKQTLRFIILPQVLSYMIPVYKNEMVSLIKLTSIASYISIIDLTKASDIVRNRTYEAFFPLIFTAFIYFLICFLLGKILDYADKRMNPRRFSE